MYASVNRRSSKSIRLRPRCLPRKGRVTASSCLSDSTFSPENATRSIRNVGPGSGSDSTSAPAGRFGAAGNEAGAASICAGAALSSRWRCCVRASSSMRCPGSWTDGNAGGRAGCPSPGAGRTGGGGTACAMTWHAGEANAQARESCESAVPRVCLLKDRATTPIPDGCRSSPAGGTAG